MTEKDQLMIEQVDRALSHFAAVRHIKRPAKGWIRTVREALGMSAPQLGRRVGSKASQSIEDIQASEVNGSIKLRTLAKIAEAMDCDLVYALVPRTSLQETRRREAERIARQMLTRVSHTMSLENQSVTSDAARSKYERHVAKLLSGSFRRIWDQ